MHGHRRLLVVPIALATLFTLAAARAATAQHEGHTDVATAENLGATTTAGALSPKLHDLGSYSRKASTRSAQAQTYFDQGLMLAYAFNHAEAQRAFREAQRLDPGFAMAWWGQAYVLGPNINAPMYEGAVGSAYEAVRKAVELEGKAKPWEQGLIAALAVHYGTDPKADRKPLDAAYARAMQDLATRHPKDPDILAMAAESIMDTDPWNYWTNDGHPRPYTEDVLRLIESALAVSPSHPLALHLHIHATEASQDPDRALASAEKLGRVAPGAGHLVHMPGHAFFRVGRYQDAVQANLDAIAVDESYITQCRAQGIYPAAYYPHNIHFLWIASAYLGKSADALDAAHKTASKAHPGLPLPTDQFLVTPLHTLVKFARWKDVLGYAQPPAENVFATGLWHFARGMALANTGDPGAAQAELEALRAARKNPAFPPQLLMVNSSPARLAEIAERSLAGEIAWQRGEKEKALAELDAAARLEDSLTYNEPPDWPFPVRHSLGALLLDLGRPVEAEAVYREDLRRRRENGWALFGLVQSLRAQGEDRATDLAQAEARFQKAWAKSDLALTSSRF